MKRYYYADLVKDFLRKDFYAIYGEITSSDKFAVDELQKASWEEEIRILKRELVPFRDGKLLFEYTIPRIGDRIDNVLIHNGIIFLLEFKVGEKHYPVSALEQVTDYALDLRCFHKESHNKLIIPILIATNAFSEEITINFVDDDILQPLHCNQNNLGKTISTILNTFERPAFSADEWINSLYMPTPTIIEAAKALYNGHHVEDISRNDASAINLSNTTNTINQIIDFSKSNNRKSICFITGVPGAGKTLAGLNISVERQRIDTNEHAVFLSGNWPLVAVLQEALARDKCKKANISKSEAYREVKDFIQIIHHFRDDAISTDAAPYERVAIFDEAQRAWTEDQLSKFMKQKKGVINFNMSEPEFLISIMNRHTDWASIICLVGGGQEINTGEAGLTEWFTTIKNHFPNWDVYVSDRITDSEYTNGINVKDILPNIHIKPELHLAVSLRSFRSEKVSAFVKSMLDINPKEASNLYQSFAMDYPIVMTRCLETAKKWILSKAKGSQRYGMVASSGAKRLRTYGIWVQSKIDAPTWFLNDKEDVRSSFFLEETATEFDIQGLELDWVIVCWDADLRFQDGSFDYLQFNGTNWQKINKTEKVTYLKNTYRVLLTRARQGFVIFIPFGDDTDKSRKPEFYDGIYQYLKQIGIREI